VTLGRRARGAQAEDDAIKVLRKAGYRVVDRNFRCRIGELDVVALDGDTLVFIEVRSRRDVSFGGGIAAISGAKMKQVARVAAAYVAIRRPVFTTCRFDVVAVTGDEITHIRDAFRITW
jgi:putative endonuclease